MNATYTRVVGHFLADLRSQSKMLASLFHNETASMSLITTVWPCPYTLEVS